MEKIVNKLGFDPYDAGTLTDIFKIQADSNVFGFEGNCEALQKLINKEN